MMLLWATMFAAKANPVDMRTAREVAVKFMNANSKLVLQSPNDLQLAMTYSTSKGTSAFHVFNTPTGFVIVSADDCAYPILGYSDKGKQFDLKDIPIQLQDILQEYLEQIQHAIENHLVADEQTAQQWRNVKTTGLLNNNRDNSQVGPLLTTTWDQGQYYNAMCPDDPEGPDGHCVTGCVATAMAQIIRYWEYPQHGKGIHNYESNIGWLNANFAESDYNYINMPDELSAESNLEEIISVAKLMYDCGVATNTTFGASESGSQVENVRTALIGHFGFANNLGFAQRHLYSDKEWSDTLKAHIDRGWPVFYSGRNVLVGHAFVLDGYKQDGYYHFNFGWGGMCDGWYLISAINPSMNFSEWQSAILGIRPDNLTNTVICHTTLNCWVSDVFTINLPIDLYHLRGGSDYWASNELWGVRNTECFIPYDNDGQLVLDVLDFNRDQSVAIYDGPNKDSLVRVLETREGGAIYEGLPSDTLFQQLATTDFSPIVSTRHGFTIVAYSYGAMREGFHLRISDASDCRMVSDLSTIEHGTEALVSWTENGNASRWQVKVGETIYDCETTQILLTELSNDNTYNVMVRAICGGENYSSWNTIAVNRKAYWTDVVRTEPEGYTLDGDTIRITSPQGLAWVARCIDSLSLGGFDAQLYQYDHRFISIENDIDLDGYLWDPIRCWFGNVDGNGHIISNMKVNNWSDNTYSRGYGGLFSVLFNSEIQNLGFRKCNINALGCAGAIAGSINDDCIVRNCFSEDHSIWSANNGTSGGLVGSISNSQIYNCYAYGDINALSGYGGIAGSAYNSIIQNCVTRLGESFSWSNLLRTPEWRGLVSEEVQGGSFSNCFSDISVAKRSWPSGDPEYVALAKRAYFLGNVYSVDAIENLAAFNIALDARGILIADTAVNYTLGDNMDVITALNNWVAVNSSNYKTWMMDSETHLPVFVNHNVITENEILPVAIYPNPTNGSVKIEAEALQHIRINNLLGQVSYEGDASGDMFEYDLGKHGTGVYLVIIKTANGTIAKKVSVVR